MCFHRLPFRITRVFLLLILVSACKRATPSPVPARAELLAGEVSKDSELFFTYVEANGIFATTDRADKVPEIARRLVRIMGRAKGEPARQNHLNVEVVDVRELLAKGRTRPQTMSREAFESGALAQLPPGDSCSLAGPHGPPLVEVTEKDGTADEPPIVIHYGTRWCTACKSARQYLLSNQIPFTFKDIEKDPSAARELEQKASHFGLPADRVPVLDVRGRLLVGYDETRLNGFLADW